MISADGRAAEAVRRRGTALLAAGLAICALAAAAAGDPIPPAFDWRNVDGKDYTTPVRDQGQCGSCWAFAAVGALEAKLEITADQPAWDPDYSEQHLLSEGSWGSCAGGHEFLALNFITSTGIVTEAELPYAASDTSPFWPLAPGWENRVAVSTGNNNFMGDGTPYLKLSLQVYGPLVAAMNTAEWYWPAGADPGGEGGAAPGDEPLVINHVVLVVGYADDATLAEGGYWIVKNSWGTGWGDGGYGYMLYGDIEQYSRVHAITGDAYVVPEPATLGMLLGGAGMLMARRRSGRQSAGQSRAVRRQRATVGRSRRRLYLPGAARKGRSHGRNKRRLS